MYREVYFFCKDISLFYVLRNSVCSISVNFLRHKQPNMSEHMNKLTECSLWAPGASPGRRVRLPALPRGGPNWNIWFDILPTRIRWVCQWEDLMEDWGWGVVSILMSGPRLKGSVPRKWAIKIEDLFIFLPPFSFPAFGMGCRSQADC